MTLQAELVTVPRSGKSIGALVEWWSETAGDQCAIRSGDQRISYTELTERSGALAARLRAAGIGAESRVGVLLPRSPDMVITLLAVLRAGGAYVPIDPDYPDAAREFMLADADVAAIVTGPGGPAELSAGDRTVLRIDEVGDAPVTALPEVDPAQAAYLVYTSGSTGRRKGVVVEHRQVLQLIDGDPRLAVSPGETVAQLASTSFDASVFEVWGALCRGGTVVILPGPPLSIQELGKQLRSSRIDWLFLTTGLFHLLADSDPEALDHVGTLLTGGDVLSPKHVGTAAGRTRAYAAYGPTETTVFASLHRAATAGADRVPLGTPLAGRAMYILDDQLRPCAPGVVGELYLGGAGLARSYHRRPATTAERFLPDPFGDPGARMYRTGDLGEVLPDGEIGFHGRTDRQVKVRGFRIELGELESVLDAHPQAGGAVVVATATAADEKRLVAYVSGRGGTQPAVSDLRSWAAQRLPAYALPATYVVLDAFPLDDNGKIDRRALAEPWVSRAGIADLPEYAAPRTDLELTVATACADALELDQVGVHDNFFALGGDSLRSVAVLERLRTQGIELTAADFFSAPTVAELAAVVTGAEAPTLTPADG